MGGASRPFAIGGYVIEAKLGEGGMGSVYKATHPRFPGQHFALKVLIGDGPPERDALVRFERETRALASVTAHPGIVRVFGGHFDGQTPFVVMELVPGKSLDGLAKDGGLEPERAARIVRETCEAIHYVHEQGVIHRDLKPANVLVEANDKPRVCDFGLAKIAGASRLTRTGEVVGTALYSAPEQLDGGAHDVDRAADTYALGAVLYYALTGKPPFEGDKAALLKRVLFDQAVPPSRHKKGIPVSLDRVCLRALQKDPRDRYQDCIALRDDLDRALRGEAVARLPIPRSTKMGVLAVILLGGLAFAGARWRRVEEMRQRSLEDTFQAALRAPTRGEITAHLAALEKEGALPERIAKVRARALELSFEEAHRALAARPLKDVPVAEVLAVVSAGLVAPSRASLVGETPGTVALGHLLLDRRDESLVAARARDAKKEARQRELEDARVLFERAKNLAVPGVDAVAGPLAVLRAYCHLADIGGPRRALGGGNLVEISPHAPEGLAQARTFADPEVRARALWLRVDLLASTGQDDAARAARQGLPADPAAAVLDRVLALPKDDPVATIEQLLAEHASPFVLSRYAARVGLPGLFEHPELADGKTPLGRALAQDEPRAFMLHGAPGDVTEKAADAAVALAKKAEVDRLQPPKVEISDKVLREIAEVEREVAERRARWGRPVDEGLAKAVAATPWPLDPQLLVSCAVSFRTGLPTAVFAALRSRTTCAALEDLGRAFDRTSRDRSRAGSGYDYWVARSWDPDDRVTGRAAVAAFDERLRKEGEADPPSVVLARREPDAWRCAVRGVEGLRRLEELVAENGTYDVRLAVEAAVRFESLRELGGPAVLAPRAKLRRLLLHEEWSARWGDALAGLDLARAYRAAEDEKREEARAGLLAYWAAAAGAPGLEVDPELAYDLVLIGAHLTREREIFRAFNAPPGRRAAEVRDELAARKLDVGAWRYLEGIKDVVRTLDLFERLLAPGPDDEARLREAPRFREFDLLQTRRRFPFPRER